MGINNSEMVELKIDGHKVTATSDSSIIQALWSAGYPRIKGVGCLEGVCGSCRVMLRRNKESGVEMALGCQTLAEEGMDVMFLDFPTPSRHSYHLGPIASSWDLQDKFHEIFPEAENCRHCGGCDTACPKGIEVQKGVRLASNGSFREAGELFTVCVSCDLCMTGCPENIAPNRVGLFARRATAHFHGRPPNLIHRLEQIRRGELAITYPEKLDKHNHITD
ncbi:MAG: 2Fe-2S iron-sulfur cluster-binding protein [Chromatiales bacterium]|nr:2Fe-2S iron-sulfur cluster-binding protein [Chromatiales bacterium]